MSPHVQVLPQHRRAAAAVPGTVPAPREEPCGRAAPAAAGPAPGTHQHGLQVQCGPRGPGNFLYYASPGFIGCLATHAQLQCTVGCAPTLRPSAPVQAFAASVCCLPQEIPHSPTVTLPCHVQEQAQKVLLLRPGQATVQQLTEAMSHAHSAMRFFGDLVKLRDPPVPLPRLQQHLAFNQTQLQTARQRLDEVRAPDGGTGWEQARAHAVRQCLC